MWRLIGRSVGTYLSLCFGLLNYWLHIESFWYHRMHVWLLYSFCDIDMLIMLIDYVDWDSDVGIFLWFTTTFAWDIDMLIILIDTLALLSIVTLILPWSFYSLTCILPIFVTICLDFHSLYVDVSDIYVLYFTVCCMTALLYVIACRLSVWAAHLSPYLQPSGFGHFFHSGSYFCKCEVLCVFVPLAEIEVRSKV